MKKNKETLPETEPTPKKKRKVGKIIRRVILAILLVLILLIAYLVREGVHGRGALSFVAYLTNPGQLTEEIYTVNVQDFEVQNDEQTIRGKLYVPEDGLDSRPFLVISHGFNCQSDLLSRKANSLAQAGIATVLFDFRGGSTRGQSDGEMIDMTLSSEISDLNTVIDYTKEHNDWVDENKIFLMGESFGGLVSSQTAPLRSDIAGVILCFPALHVQDAAKSLWSSVDEIPENYDVNGATTGKAYWEELWNLDVYGNLAKYTGKVMILHGTEDQMVDPDYSVKANLAYTDSELFFVEGAGHGFGGADQKETLKSMLRFIQKETLKK